MNSPRHLYTPNDVKKVREKLLQEQEGRDLLTGLPLTAKDAVVDHSHSTHLVRGVIHRQSNAVLGKIENLYTRYLKWWYNGTLSEFLRNAADYLDRELDMRYVHPGWLKAYQTKFNTLSETQKKEVLKGLARPEGSNSKERKNTFRKTLLSRQFTMSQIEDLINKVKA